MKSKGVLIMFIIVCFTLNCVKAQSYKIQSFDGNEATIKLFYKPSSGMLTVSYLQDTLLINNYMAIDTVDILNRALLQINYIKRAGSNEDAANQLILYVSHGRLCQALHINSLATYDMRPSEYFLFKLKVTLAGLDVNTYKLAINIHNEKTYERRPRLNYKYNKINSLSFDKEKKIFFSNYEPINGYYIFHELSAKKNIKKYLKNNIPIVKIEGDKYYYINRNWYTKDKNDFYSMFL